MAEQGSHPLATAGILLAVLLIAGGGTAAAVILTSDGEKKGDGTGGEPSPVSTVDWCAAVEALEDDDEINQEPSKAADLLREAGVPKGMPDEALRGRDLIIEIAEDSADGKAAEAAFRKLGEKDTADANAFFAYYAENCLEDKRPSRR